MATAEAENVPKEVEGDVKDENLSSFHPKKKIRRKMEEEEEEESDEMSGNEEAGTDDTGGAAKQTEGVAKNTDKVEGDRSGLPEADDVPKGGTSGGSDDIAKRKDKISSSEDSDGDDDDYSNGDGGRSSKGGEKSKRKTESGSEDEEDEEEEVVAPRKKSRRPKSAFIEHEASESEGAEDEEDDSEGGARKRKRKKLAKKKKKKKVVDSEDDSDEDDDDDDNEDRYEVDGFVVDDEDEDEEESEARRRRRRRSPSPTKKRKRLKRIRDDDELDEEDYALISENLGLEAPEDEEKRRLEKLKRDAERREREAEARRKHIVASSGMDLESQLFGEDDDEDEGDVGSRRGRGEGRNEEDDEDVGGGRRGGEGPRGRRENDRIEREEYDSDDMNEFIVDDEEGEEGGEGMPRRREGGEGRPGQKKHRGVPIYGDGPSSYQIGEAEELFGDMSDFLAATKGKGVQEEKKKVDITAIYEPSVLKEHLATAEDDKIRSLDVPERFQTWNLEKREVDADERTEQAQWIFDQLTFERQVRDRSATCTAIEAVLKFYQEDLLEPPFIATYRREFIEPHGIRPHHLWTILDLDIKWSRIKSKKEALRQILKETLTKGKASGRDLDPASEIQSAVDAEDGSEATQEERDSRAQMLRLEEIYGVLVDEFNGEDQLKDLHNYLSLVQDSFELARSSPAATLGSIEDKASGVSDKPSQSESTDAASEDKDSTVAHESGDKEDKDKTGAEAAKSSAKSLSDDDDEEEEEDKGEGERKQQQTDTSRTALAQAQAQANKDSSKALEESQKKKHKRPGGGGAYKRPVKRDFYRICRRSAPLRAFAATFSLSASQLGESLQTRGGGMQQGRQYDVPTVDSSPAEAAAKFVSREFSSSKDVLKGVRYLLAAEIAAEPQIRSLVRELYRNGASVFTAPTEKGRAEIDLFHSLHGLQYIREKPLRYFLENKSDREQFLALLKGEKLGLITLRIQAPPLQAFLDIMEPPFISLGMSDGDWDQVRRFILMESVNLHLIPALERESRAELFSKAREAVALACAEKLREKVMTGPFRVLSGEDSVVPGLSLEASEIVSMGVCVGLGRSDPSYAAMMDPDGEVLDFLLLPDFRSPELRTKLKDFMVAHQPHVIVVNTSAGMTCRRMANIVHDVAEEVREHLRRRQKGRQKPSNVVNGGLRVTLAEDEVPRIFAASPRGEKEFPEYHHNLRQAISLGRYMQNPLSEICALWNNLGADEGSEILYLKVHPLQDQVGSAFLLKEYERCLVDAVALAGVDLNQSAHHTHCGAMLQFVAGLGPRKALALAQAVQRRGHLESRADLQSLGILGKTVFANAAGFLRIRERATLKDLLLDPLDDTRIHPESYFMAVKMCADASGSREVDLYDASKYQPVVEDVMYDSSKAIRKMMREEEDRWEDRRSREPRDQLSELDLEAYAKVLEKENRGWKLLTLEDIKSELRYPFQDQRRPYRDPTAVQLFYWLTGETETSLQEGMVVTARVTELQDRFVRVQLDSGLRGIIFKENLSDNSRMDDRVEDIVGLGETLDAKIMAIKKERFSVELSSRESELSAPPLRWPSVDPYFDSRAADEDYRQKREASVAEKAELERGVQSLSVDEHIHREKLAEAQQRRQRRAKRQVVHPAFRNVLSSVEAQTYLAEKPIGDAVFRPSSIGPDNLTLTWKMAEDRYVHVDIKEEEKEEGQRLGAKLRIKNEVYEDLDEILARYVAPMNDLVEELVSHEKFRKGDRAEVEALLQQEKQKNPARIPYVLRFSEKAPNWFAISAIPRTSVRSEQLAVEPEGLRFKGRLETSRPFPSVDRMLRHYKKHFNDAPPPPQQPPHTTRSSGGHHSTHQHQHQHPQHGHRAHTSSASAAVSHASRGSHAGHTSSYYGASRQRDGQDHYRSSHYGSEYSAGDRGAYGQVSGAYNGRDRERERGGSGGGGGGEYYSYQGGSVSASAAAAPPPPSSSSWSSSSSSGDHGQPRGERANGRSDTHPPAPSERRQERRSRWGR